MKNYSVLVKLVVCCALVCGTFQIASYGQGRKLNKQQIDAIVIDDDQLIVDLLALRHAFHRHAGEDEIVERDHDD